MRLQSSDGLVLIAVAVVEVVLIEALIRLDLVGVERASGILFVLLLLNFSGLALLQRRR